MKRVSAILCGLLAATSFLTDAAHADKRVALVIGNGAYQSAPALATPANDANSIADLLRRSGFDVVEVRTDLGNTDFKRMLREFSSNARAADVAVMYFAGHGIDVGGKNYLLPVDVKLASDLDAEDEAVSLDRVMAGLQGAKGLRVVVLDAARDNPLARTMQRTKGGSPTGLARLEPDADDTFIVYAARPGTLSEDIAGDRSAFADALLKNLAVPGRDIRTAIGFARDDVIKATGGKQEVLVVGAYGGRALALVPEQKVTRQIAVLPSGQAEQANAAPEPPAGPKRIAVLPAPGSQQQAPVQNIVTAPPPAVVPPSDPAVVARELQSELRRVGCDPGAINGVWSPGSRQALEQFNRRASMNLETKVASVDALDAVKGQRGRICPLVCAGGQRVDGERCVAIPAQPKQAPKKAAVREEPAPRRRVRQVVEDDAPPPRRAPVVVREEAPMRSAPPIGLPVPGIGIGIGGIGLRF
ncbi:MAG: caspase family protein [Pseudorhodoplanes sp.]